MFRHEILSCAQEMVPEHLCLFFVCVCSLIHPSPDLPHADTPEN